MANFYSRGAAPTGYGSGYNAKSAAQKMWGASAVNFGGRTYTPDASSIGAGEIRNSFIPAGILKNLKITEQGVGLLVKAEATIELYNPGGLSGLGPALGGTFNCSVGPFSSFATYDLSITNIQPQGWEVTLKGIAKGRVGVGSFVDMANVQSLSGLSMTMGISQWFISEFGDFDEVNTAAINDFRINTKPSTSTLFATRTSLADYVEGKCWDAFELSSKTSFFDLFDNHGSPSVNFGQTMAMKDTFGIPLWPNNNEHKTKGGYSMKMANYHPERQNHPDALISSGFCGWVQINTLLDALDSEVLSKHGYSLDKDTYSACSIPSDDRFFCARPYENLAWWAVNTVYTITGTPYDAYWTSPVDGSSYSVKINGNSVGELYSSNLGTVGSDWKKMWISTTWLRRVQEEISLPNPQPGEPDDVSVDRRVQGSFPFGRFMEKLFDQIRSETGGIIDLTIDGDRDDVASGNGDKIFIIARKPNSPANSASSLPLTSRTDSGYGIRDIKVAAHVPKSVAARLFSKAPEASGLSNAEIYGGVADPEQPSYNKDEITKGIADAGLVESEFSDTVLAGANAIGLLAIKDNSHPMDPPALPSEISAVIDLNTNIQFGQSVRISPSPSILGGSKVVWTITEVSHQVTGTDGTTEFKAIARIKG
jgi:hypothetical protein